MLLYLYICLVLFVKLVYAFLYQGKTTKVEESNESKSTNEGIDPKSSGNETKAEEQET